MSKILQANFEDIDIALNRNDFEDIIITFNKNNSLDIMKIFMEITDYNNLVLALKNASNEVKEAFFPIMSSKMAEIVKNDINLLENISEIDIKTAHEIIINRIRELKQKGEIGAVAGHYACIFDLCRFLKINNLYDIGCGYGHQARLLTRYLEMNYTGIDPFIDESAKVLFTNMLGSRFKLQEMKYPYFIMPPENNIAISKNAMTHGVGKEEIEKIALHFSRDFERIIISIDSEMFKQWQNALTDFEICKIGFSSSESDDFIFGTKFLDDIFKMRKQYEYIDNRFMIGMRV